MPVAVPLVELPTSMAAAIWHKPCRFRHSLAGHPLLTREAIAKLASERPRWSVNLYQTKDLILGSSFPAPPRGDPATLAAEINTSGSRVVLAFIDHVDSYGALVGEASSELRSLLGVVDGAVRARTGTLFLSAPNTVAPAHFDRHHNLLLQVEGTKRLSVGVLDGEHARRELTWHFRDDDYLHGLPAAFETFVLEPGDGLYIPPYAPHWVEGSDSVSIALSCSVRTRASHEVELANVFSAKLRRVGLQFRPAVPRSRASRMKARLVTTWTVGRGLARSGRVR